MDNEPKITIGIPTGGTVKTKTVLSLLGMIKKMPYRWNTVMRNACLIHTNREVITQKAIELGSTHLLFVDDDMTFEPDAFNRLFDRKKEIIGVATHLRQFPLTSTLKDLDENGNKIWEEYPDGLIKCAGVGTGFLLIDLSVFKKIPQPWYFFESNDKGELVCGEDMWFCRKAIKAGYDIWADSTIKVGHLGEYES